MMAVVNDDDDCWLSSSSHPDPRPAHLEPFRQVTAKARVDLSPSTRWSFLTCVCTRPERPQLQNYLTFEDSKRDFGGGEGGHLDHGIKQPQWMMTKPQLFEAN